MNPEYNAEWCVECGCVFRYYTDMKYGCGDEVTEVCVMCDQMCALVQVCSVDVTVGMCDVWCVVPWCRSEAV